MSSRPPTVYRRAVSKEFDFLKRATRFEELLTRGLDLPHHGGMAVPCSRLHADDAELPDQLAAWGHAAPLPEAEARTREAAAAWLSRLLESPDRIGFLLLDKHGRRRGFVALADAPAAEATLTVGAVLAAEGGKRMASEAIRTLLLWVHDTLFPAQVTVGVAAGEVDRIGFFLDSGFEPIRREGASLLLRFRATRETPGQSLISTAGPSISAREASYALDAARHGWNDQWNKYLRAFETAFAEYVGVKHALATSSCTGALHLALLALGVKAADEVIVPELTWVATANAVRYVGATPVFADVEENSWCLDPESFEEKITPRTRAVIPVHLYGHPARMDRIMDVARRHDLRVIEDAAPSIGAEYHGKRTGSFGDFAGFSFQGAKLVVSGEGGMLVTDSTKLYQRACKVWDQGRIPGTFWIDELGWKYKMANVQAAIGLGQLERVEELVEAKRRVRQWYEEGLAGVPHVRLSGEAPGARSICWMTSLLLEEGCPQTREELRAGLKRRNVDTRDVFPAISQYPIWPVKQPPQPRANRIGARALNLPSGVCLRREHVDYVCACVRDLIEGGKPA